MLKTVEARTFIRASKPNILVIDDDVFLGLSVCRLLDRAGFNCVNVVNLQGMLDAIELGFVPDLVVTDLYINAESGCDVLQYFRQHEHYGHTPVLLISSDQVGPDIAVDYNFDGFLSKSGLFSALFELVHQLLSWERDYLG